MISSIRIRNRKAVEEGLTLWICIITLMLAMIFFGIVTFLSPKTSLELRLATSTIDDSKLTLINYLRTSLPEKTMQDQTMQDMIIRWYYDRSIEPELVKRTKDIFTPLYGDCYTLTFQTPMKETILAINSKKSKDITISQRIPLPDDSSLIITLNPTYFYDKCNNPL